MCMKPLITEDLPKHPPIGADTTVPRWAIAAYSTPQAMPLPRKDTNEPFAMVGAFFGWMWAVMFGKRIERKEVQ